MFCVFFCFFFVKQKTAYEMRISDWSSDVCSSDLQACVDRFGRIDVLHNNVGGSAPGGPVEMTEEVWDRQMDHNLRNVYLTCKHVLPIMERQGAGAIVNIASVAGMRHIGTNIAAYAASKARSEEHTSELQSLMRIS